MQDEVGQHRECVQTILYQAEARAQTNTHEDKHPGERGHRKEQAHSLLYMYEQPNTQGSKHSQTTNYRSEYLQTKSGKLHLT